MGEIKHTARFAEIERIFGDYFNSHLAPVMRDTQNYLNRKQAEEMAAYSTSAAVHRTLHSEYRGDSVTDTYNCTGFLNACFAEKIRNLAF